MTDTQVMAALEPFAKLANVILSETPAEADDIVLFTDCQRRPHAISMDQLRAASVALASSSPAEPVAWAYRLQGDPPTWFASTRWKASDIGKWTETPLYAAPVPPPAGDAVLRKALQAAIDWDDHTNPAGYAGLPTELRVKITDALATPPSVPVQQGVDNA